MRQIIVAGNWKMNASKETVKESFDFKSSSELISNTFEQLLF
jgi:triosephosphate isomerase